MKNIIPLLGIACLMSCGNSLRLSVPEKFKQQANMQHVNGARKNKMSFGNFTTSKIKRGRHVSYPGWGNIFLRENILLNRMGIQKDEIIRKEKARFRYTLSDGNNSVEIYGTENELTKKLRYELTNGIHVSGSYERLQQYQYLFSAVIVADTTQAGKSWQLIMTDVYDRQKENNNTIFTIAKQNDNGFAANGTDTVFIKPVSISNAETPNGKIGRLPVKILSGYELSTADGVVAIIDMIDKNIWFYNELDAAEKLNISAIATAIFARKVHEAW